MYAVCVTFKIKSEMMDAFMPLMHRQAKASLENEEACKRFDVCTDADRPNEVFLYELYDDADAFQVHLNSEHFKTFDESVKDMLEDKIVATYEAVYSP